MGEHGAADPGDHPSSGSGARQPEYRQERERQGGAHRVLKPNKEATGERRDQVLQAYREWPTLRGLSRIFGIAGRFVTIMARGIRVSRIEQ